jgi:type I restriction enzyme S subunit
MTGSAQPGINTTFPKYYDLLIPTKKEQEKIADILSTIDDNIFETDRIIAECEHIKIGLMQTLLLKGILGKHKKFKKTELGEIPEDWEIKAMKDLGSFDKGKGISKKEVTESGIPCIRYGEIYTTHHFKIKEFFSFIDKETTSESTLISKGDILLAGSGETLEDIGKAVTYLGTEEAYAGGDTIIFKPKKQNSLYLSYVLNSGIIREQINRLGQGHSVVHLYPRQLMNVKIPVPSIKEQDEIANILDEIDYKIDVEKEKRTAILKLKVSLMQKLLSGEIRVRV